MEIRGRAVHHGARRSSQQLQGLRQGECPELEASLDSIGIRVQPGLHVETLFQNETFKKKKGGGVEAIQERAAGCLCSSVCIQGWQPTHFCLCSHL